jgi:cytochrome c5
MTRWPAIAAGLAALTCGGSLRADDDASATRGSIREGIFSEAQALRGREIYADPCGKCHGYKLDGAPDDPDMFPTRPVAGPKFLRDWSGRSLAALFEYTRTTMPANNPAYLSDQEYADLVAYMLYASGVPAGSHELTPEPAILAAFIIEQELQ